MVPEVVEAELGVGAVGDVGLVGSLPGLLVHPLLDQPHLEAQKLVDRPHPVAVPPGQVIVHRDHMYLARESVEVGRHGGDQGLPLAGLHLGDPPLVEDDPTQDLDVVGVEADGPFRCLPDHRERLREEVVQRLPFGQAGLELVGFGSELGVGGAFDLLRPGVDLLHQGQELFQFLLVGLAEHEVQGLLKRHHDKRLYDSDPGPATSPLIWSICGFRLSPPLGGKGLPRSGA